MGRVALNAVKQYKSLPPTNEKQLWVTFQIYDSNGDGLLSKAELENAHTCPTGEPAVSSAMLMPVSSDPAPPQKKEKASDPAPPQKKEKASDPAVLCPGGTVSSPKLMPIMPMETDPISTLTDKRNIYEEEKNERVKYAARYGFTTSFGFLTTEQLMEKFKQCDVNNVRQLTRAELKKRFQYLNKEELNKLVKHAPKLGFTVEP